MGKNILNIYGEKFSGKSHLSEIFKKKNKAIIIKTHQINENFFNKIRFHENIILDNLDYISNEKFYILCLILQSNLISILL